MFELLCAGWLCRFAADVDLVEPPDVACRFDGGRWGVACKAAYGQPSTTAKAIRRGAEQLEESDVEAGVVCVRITDVFGARNPTLLQLCPESAGSEGRDGLVAERRNRRVHRDLCWSGREDLNLRPLAPEAAPNRLDRACPPSHASPVSHTSRELRGVRNSGATLCRVEDGRAKAKPPRADAPSRYDPGHANRVRQGDRRQGGRRG
jgi:hypothetical protein